MIKQKELEELNLVYNQLKSQRQPYTEIWRKVARWIDPWYGNMDIDKDPGNNPLPSDKEIYDTTVGFYSQVFSTGLQGYTCSSQSAFFELAPENNTSEKEDQKLTEILQSRTRKMYKVFQKSGFYKSVHSFFKSFGDLSTGIMMFGINKDNKIYFENVPIYQCLIMEDKTLGIVDTLFRTIWLTRYEAIKMYGEDNIPEDILKETKAPTTRYKFIQLICPRDRFELTLDDNEWKYIEIVWCPSYSEKTVFEGGSDSLRFAVCPFAEGEDGTGWGIGGPGTRQFSSAHTLQNMMRDQMNASQLLAAPPMKKTEGLHAEIRPGGFINIPPGGDIAPLQLGGDLSWLNATKMDVRQIAKSDYFVDYFLMLSQYQGNVNTATLAQGLQNEQLKMMTFFLDILQQRFFEPVIDWTWNTMGALGLFNDGFDVSYESLQVDYISPLFKLQRQAITLEPTIGAMNTFLPYLQIDPSLAYYVDFGGFVEVVKEGMNADTRVVRDKQQAEQLIVAQQKAQQQAAEKEAQIRQQEADTNSYLATLKGAEPGSDAERASSNPFSGIGLR